VLDRGSGAKAGSKPKRQTLKSTGVLTSLEEGKQEESVLPEEAVWIYSGPKAREWKQEFKSSSSIQGIMNMLSKLPKETRDLHLRGWSKRS